MYELIERSQQPCEERTTNILIFHLKTLKQRVVIQRAQSHPVTETGFEPRLTPASIVLTTLLLLHQDSPYPMFQRSLSTHKQSKELHCEEIA